MGFQKFQLVILFLILASAASLPSEYSVVGHDFNEFVSEERVLELFQRWKDKHGKAYTHTGEAERRFKNFKNNLEYIVEKKNNPSGHVVGLNKFADMSNEEFRETYLKKIQKPTSKAFGNAKSNSHKTVQSCEAPSSLDWRKRGIVTPVKDQGSCGSCWSFSTTGAIEGINALVTGDLISLSEQELVDCDTTNYGCDGGNMDYAFDWVIKNGGIDTESDYPYTGVDGTCNITKEETKAVSIDGYKDVEPFGSALLCAAVQQPISVGMVGSSIDFQLYTSGIYNGDCSNDPYYIDHAVLIVGYGSENGEDYWIVKNSWGTSWGIDGYFYIIRDHRLEYGKCAINVMASYPIKESYAPSPYSPPSGPPPPPPPPPPPSPSPSQCGEFSYCPSGETCCCIFEFLDFCLIYGCCPYENAVCCAGTQYCCPGDYPICDIEEGLCLKKCGDYLGILVKNRTLAKHKLPWTKIEETEKMYQSLQWKRNPFAAIR